MAVLVKGETGRFHAIEWERRDGHIVAVGRWQPDGPLRWRSWPASKVQLTEIDDTETPHERHMKINAALAASVYAQDGRS